MQTFPEIATVSDNSLKSLNRRSEIVYFENIYMFVINFIQIFPENVGEYFVNQFLFGI
jgi:hypothetical protein